MFLLQNSRMLTQSLNVSKNSSQHQSKCFQLMFEVLEQHSFVESILWIILAAISVLLNITVILRNLATSFKTAHDIYLVSLYSSHLITSIFVLPVYAKLIWIRTYSCLLKETMFVIASSMIFSSLLSILAISVNRTRSLYMQMPINIAQPYLSRKKPLIVVLAIWFISTIRGVLVLLHQSSKSTRIPAIDMAIIVAAIVVLHCSLGKKLKTLQELGVQNIRDHSKAIKLVLLLTLTFIFTWVPPVIVYSVKAVIGDTYLMNSLASVSTKLIFLSPLIDPLVYLQICPQHTKITMVHRFQNI